MNRRMLKNNKLLTKPDIEQTEWSTQDNHTNHPQIDDK